MRQFLRFSEEAAHAVGLTPQQHQALLAIKGFPGREQITIGELAERLQVKHHSAVGLVNRLAAQELVVREHSSEDRRQVFVSLTTAGEDVLARLTAAHRMELRQMAQMLDEHLARIVAENQDE